MLDYTTFEYSSAIVCYFIVNTNLAGIISRRICKEQIGYTKLVVDSNQASQNKYGKILQQFQQHSSNNLLRMQKWGLRLLMFLTSQTIL